MYVIGRLLLFGGFLLAIGVPIYIVVLAFKKSAIEGLLCLIVPAYILYWAMREETKQPRALLTWVGALVSYIVGMAMLTD